MDVVEVYLDNLKRFEKADKYFQSLSQEKLEEVTKEDSKVWQEFLKIIENLNKLYPLAKAEGCEVLSFYDDV